MNRKYGVLIQEDRVDEEGFILRVRWFETLQQAYSQWIAGGNVGDIIKKIEPVVVEGGRV